MRAITGWRMSSRARAPKKGLPPAGQRANEGEVATPCRPDRHHPVAGDASSLMAQNGATGGEWRHYATRLGRYLVFAMIYTSRSDLYRAYGVVVGIVDAKLVRTESVPATARASRRILGSFEREAPGGLPAVLRSGVAFLSRPGRIWSLPSEARLARWPITRENIATPQGLTTVPICSTREGLMVW